jgi:hypothetical protein
VPNHMSITTFTNIPSPSIQGTTYERFISILHNYLAGPHVLEEFFRFCKTPTPNR